MEFIDHFDGPTIDNEAWEIVTTGVNTVSPDAGQLRLDAADGESIDPRYAVLRRRASLSGDFIVSMQMDATITLNPSFLNFGWAVVVLRTPGNIPERIGFWRFGSLDLVLAHLRVEPELPTPDWFFTHDDYTMGVVSLPIGIDQAAATLRFSRSGNIWTVEADLHDDQGFQQVSQFVGCADPVELELFALCAGNPVLALLDDYMENAGDTEGKEEPTVVAYRFSNLGCDLLLDDDDDLGISVTGDLALTPSGRVCLLQDIADLLETLPKDLFGHPGYGAGIGRLFGESYKPDFVSHVERAIKDALTNDPSVSPRLVPGNTRVEMRQFSDTELSVSIVCEAISDCQIIPLNLVWEYGIDDLSRIREVA